MFEMQTLTVVNTAVCHAVLSDLFLNVLQFAQRNSSEQVMKVCFSQENTENCPFKWKLFG